MTCPIPSVEILHESGNQNPFSGGTEVIGTTPFTVTLQLKTETDAVSYQIFWGDGTSQTGSFPGGLSNDTYLYATVTHTFSYTPPDAHYPVCGYRPTATVTNTCGATGTGDYGDYIYVCTGCGSILTTTGSGEDVICLCLQSGANYAYQQYAEEISAGTANFVLVSVDANPSTVSVGDIVLVTATVENKGNGAGQAVVEFLDASGNSLGQVQTPPIAAGSTGSTMIPMIYTAEWVGTMNICAMVYTG